MSLWKEIHRENCDYTYCYCEENIYRLGEYLLRNYESELSLQNVELYVIFISSPKKQTFIWRQKSAQSIDEPVCWDYHVVLCCRGTNRTDRLIFDFDTTLPFPCNLIQYSTEAFRPDIPIKDSFRQ